MSEASIALSLSRLATAALAGTIGIFAARAYLKLRRRSLLMLALGATILAAGYLVEGLLVEVGGWAIADATVVESVTTLVAATILVGSLYLRDTYRPAPRPPPEVAP